jgi:hypothetical protein
LCMPSLCPSHQEHPLNPKHPSVILMPQPTILLRFPNTS